MFLYNCSYNFKVIPKINYYNVNTFEQKSLCLTLIRVQSRTTFIINSFFLAKDKKFTTVNHFNQKLLLSICVQ